MKTDLEDVLKVAHASGGKVNDVVLDLVTAGLRDLLVGRRNPVDGVELKASVPVSLRPSADAKDLGNESGALVIPLPVFEADARRCLERIVAGTAKAKAEQRPAYGQAFMSWLSRLPIAQQFIDRQRFINVLVTNVMGPPVPMYLLGARIQEVAPVIQLAGNLTLTFCAFSYAGSLYIVATADAVACPDVDTVTDGMERAWLSLCGPAAVSV